MTSAIVALALVATILRAHAALDRLHPAFGRMQLVGLFQRLVRLDDGICHMHRVWIQQLPGLHLAVMRLFSSSSFLVTANACLGVDLRARGLRGMATA